MNYELIALGPEKQHRWRRQVPPDVVIRLGRAPKDGWTVPWDLRISREHADLQLVGDRLSVRCLTTARNSIYLRGEPQFDFTVSPGEVFRIGRTTFHLDAISSRLRPEEPPLHPSEEDGASAVRLAQQPVLARLRGILSRIDADPQEKESLAQGDANGASSVRVAADYVDGAAFQNYELLDQVYRGGSGQILKARHRHLERLAVIKILSQEALEEPQTVERFWLKCKLLSHLEHPNLIRIYDAGEFNWAYYIIMEFVDGINLASWLKSETATVSNAVDWISQAARALAHAHARQTVHRNVQPEHLMLTASGCIKVIGWGSAWCAEYIARDLESSRNERIGTLDFMAPEQVENHRQVDERADIYALGCTLFTILTKRLPFPQAEAEAKITAHREQSAPSLQQLRMDVTDSLEQVYRKMVAKRPEQRFSSMQDVVAALREAV